MFKGRWNLNRIGIMLKARERERERAATSVSICFFHCDGVISALVTYSLASVYSLARQLEQAIELYAI
jgi:hypothetical protein